MVSLKENILQNKKIYVVGIWAVLCSAFQLYLLKEQWQTPLFWCIWITELLMPVFAFVYKRIPQNYFIKNLFAICWLNGAVFFQMESSTRNTLKEFVPIMIVWNLLTILAIGAVLYAIIGNLKYSGIVAVILFGIWALANYYVLLFRSVPLSPQDIISIGTAMDVIDSYHFQMTIESIQIVLLIGCEVIVCLQLETRAKANFKTTKCPQLKEVVTRVSGLIFAAAWFWIGFASPLASKVGADRSNSWIWYVAYYENGYISTTITKIFNMSIKKPVGGYSTEEVLALEQEMLENETITASVTDDMPNIVFIVNESMFNWHQVTNYTTDKEEMPFYWSLENTVRGYAINPKGMTSISEFEILGSMSTYLTPNIIPIMQLNLSGINTIISYLQGLGYSTSATHLAAGENYNRVVAYPQLGFERIVFADYMLPYKYIKTFVSDRDAFNELKNLYETSEEGMPSFTYCLTIQNHGGYLMSEQNGGTWQIDPDKKITITSEMNESLRLEMEEYLSELQYTDEVFEELIDYFESCDEKVIVCMVGDHPPVFVNGDHMEYVGSEDENLARKMATPFVIWANFPIEEKDVGYISMPQLVPVLLETAEMPLSVYYRSALSLGDSVTAMSSSFYTDENGKVHSYDEASEQIPELQRYFAFEYANLIKDSKAQSIFAPVYPQAG